MKKDYILSIVRHLLTFGGGFLISSHYLDAEGLTNGVAALITLVGIVWGVIEKLNRPTIIQK